MKFNKIQIALYGIIFFLIACKKSDLQPVAQPTQQEIGDISSSEYPNTTTQEETDDTSSTNNDHNTATQSTQGETGGISTSNQKFDCSHLFYQIYGKSAQVASINTVGSNFENIGEGYGAICKAAGYNSNDSYAYGLLHRSNQLIRIHADGSFENLGSVNALGALDWNAGDFGDDGLFYVKAGGGTDQLLGINVHTKSVDRVIQVSTPFKQGDIVYEPNGKIFYSVENLDEGMRRLISINPANGEVKTIGSPFKSAIIGAMFTDFEGRIYGAANNGSGIYEFDKITGKSIHVGNAPVAIQNDGFSCPSSNPIKH
ncbi:MAG: hypothetical protein GY810_03310 [Aureispira sp.]|nr:hypothetical protein [Aureispira sp.]